MAVFLSVVFRAQQNLLVLKRLNYFFVVGFIANLFVGITTLINLL